MSNKVDVLNTIEKFKKLFNDEYNFLPIVKENEIDQFEKKFQIKLPSDYKWFIMTIANGIENKDMWKRNILNKIDFENFFYQEKEYNPSLPFKLNTKVKFYSKEDDEGNDDFPFEVIYDTERNIFREGYLNGEITLVGYGCGTSAFLVINGNEYGNVWIDDYASNQEVYPEYDIENQKKRLNFLEWIILELEREMTFHQ
ncbi:SMI1/KNR4 family protein [Amniculibacterium sp. G2-70]|uniref:SMI1/KNR4 family protein n=1 Tax=Amniculibacterium sp. G2-70 TaxID=2767188 RepID=UPI0016545A0C|nr:SMI1/KNR4 family protein [Amniculibacterium sp. G2-70]